MLAIVTILAALLAGWWFLETCSDDGEQVFVLMGHEIVFITDVPMRIFWGAYSPRKGVSEQCAGDRWAKNEWRNNKYVKWNSSPI